MGLYPRQDTPADNPKHNQDTIIMEQTQPIYDYFVGFDVSKDTITVFNSRTNIIEDIDNEPTSLRRYAKSLSQKCLAICEPTGGYEAALLDALIDKAIPTHRADARKVKAFIRSLGIHGKTDSIDAKALAEYGSERHSRLNLWSAPDAIRQELQSLVARRQELTALQTAEKNRYQAPMAGRRAGRHVKASCKRMIKVIAEEIKKAQIAIEAIINNDKRLQDIEMVLRSVKGVGPAVASTLIACMPELGTLSRRQVASLAGLAPHPRQSGKYQGYRRVSGGRSDVKRCLFMAAMVASRRNPEMKVVYDRLRENGKKPIVALTAIMRKLIVILNARVRDYLMQNQMS
jgi:transposase